MTAPPFKESVARCRRGHKRGHTPFFRRVRVWFLVRVPVRHCVSAGGWGWLGLVGVLSTKIHDTPSPRCCLLIKSSSSSSMSPYALSLLGILLANLVELNVGFIPTPQPTRSRHHAHEVRQVSMNPPAILETIMFFSNFGSCSLRGVRRAALPGVCLHAMSRVVPLVRRMCTCAALDSVYIIACFLAIWLGSVELVGVLSMLAAKPHHRLIFFVSEMFPEKLAAAIIIVHAALACGRTPASRSRTNRFREFTDCIQPVTLSTLPVSAARAAFTTEKKRPRRRLLRAAMGTDPPDDFIDTTAEVEPGSEFLAVDFERQELRVIFETMDRNNIFYKMLAEEQIVRVGATFAYLLGLPGTCQACLEG